MLPSGQRSQNPPDVLQVQAVPQAHAAQGHPVQGWKGEYRPIHFAVALPGRTHADRIICEF